MSWLLNDLYPTIIEKAEIIQPRGFIYDKQLFYPSLPYNLHSFINYYFPVFPINKLLHKTIYINIHLMQLDQASSMMKQEIQ